MSMILYMLLIQNMHVCTSHGTCTMTALFCSARFLCIILNPNLCSLCACTCGGPTTFLITAWHTRTDFLNACLHLHHLLIRQMDAQCHIMCPCPCKLWRLSGTRVHTDVCARWAYRCVCIRFTGACRCVCTCAIMCSMFMKSIFTNYHFVKNKLSVWLEEVSKLS